MEPSGLAATLRAERERRGLSERALASRLGVSCATVHEAEHGRDVRLSTLRAYARELGVPPRRLVTGEDGGQRADPDTTWRFLRDLHGFSARLASCELRPLPDGGHDLAIDLKGVRSAAGDMRDAGVRNALLASVTLAADGLRELAERLGSGQRRVEIAGDRSVHTVRFATRATAGFDYGYRERVASGHSPLFRGGGPLEVLEAGDGAFTVLLSCPVERLRLAVSPASVTSILARCEIRAWLTGRGENEPDLRAALHGEEPGATPRVSKRTLAVSFARPMPGLVHRLIWAGTSRPTSRPAGSTLIGSPPFSRTPLPAARAIQGARRAAGLSSRALARQSGTGPQTVQLIERGRDMRHSTLVRLLGALPDLRPEDLFVDVPRAGRPADIQVWEQQRSLAGLEIECVHQEMDVSGEEWLDLSVGVKGMRTLPGRSRELVIRVARGRRAAPNAPFRTEGIRFDPPELADRVQVRTVRELSEIVLLELRVPRDVAARGLGYRCLFRLPQQRLAEPGTSVGIIRADEEAAIAELQAPARELRVRLRFPSGRSPDRMRVVPVSALDLQDLPLRDVSGFVGLDRMTLARAARHDTWLFRANRPLIGVRYLMAWPTCSS